MNAPACPRCGGPASWKAQATGWGCDRCQQMLPAAAGQAQAAAVPQAQAAAVPACPRCGGPGTFHAQANRWGCDRCRGYLDQLGPAAPALGAPPAVSAGAAQNAERAAKRAHATKMMVMGLVLLLVGVIITTVTHDEAESNGGGTYVIAYGPMIVGGIRFFQGLFGMMA